MLCNQASVDAKLRHVSELIVEKKLKLTIGCFIGPQHGIRGEKQDNMIESDDFTDAKTGLPVFSLYGVTREPTDKMLETLDAFVVDLQDIGTRIYTFMYTMANCMRAAARTGKKVIVLDRANPIDGTHVEGNVLEDGFTSFVGQFPFAPAMECRWRSSLVFSTRSSESAAIWKSYGLRVGKRERCG